MSSSGTPSSANVITRLRGAIEGADGVAARFAADNGWIDVTYPELGLDVRRIAAGLVRLGLEAGDVVAIYAETRPEWVLADLASISAGLVVATIYHSSSAEEAQHILENSGASLVFCDTAETLEKVEQIRGDLPALAHTVLFEAPSPRGNDNSDDSDDATASDDGDSEGEGEGANDTGEAGSGENGSGEAHGPLSLGDLRGDDPEGEDPAGDQADELDRRAEAPGPDDLFTLVYTSGTTGPPKGCMITHGNVVAGLDNLESVLDFDDSNGQALFYIFLPLAHVLTRLVELVAIDSGATLGFWRRDMNRILDDLAILTPTHLAAVPRIFEKIYTQAYEQADGTARRKALDTAVATGGEVRDTERRGGRVGPVQRVQHELADRTVLHRVRDLFGGRLQFALVGAAPVNRELLEFFDACGVLVLEGYGLTETTAGGSLNRPDKFRFGTQGPPAPQCEVTLAEASSADEKESDEQGSDEEATDPGREVLLRGPVVFAGYYKMPEETKEVLDDDGWFHTGDVGSIDDDGFLSITGRTKDIIVTSSGKNIPAARIENEIATSRWIEHAVLYGDEKNYLVALLTLDPDEQQALAEKAGADPDQESLAESEAARAEISDAIDAANENFARIEQVKKFAILPRGLSTEHGELTATLKVKRSVVHDNHRETFEALYQD